MLFVQNSLTHPHPKHTSTPPKHTHPTQQWHHFHHHLALRASSPFTKIGAFRTGTKNGSAKSGSQIQINVVCVRLDTARSKQSCQIRIKAPACRVEAKWSTEIRIGSGSQALALCGAPSDYLENMLVFKKSLSLIHSVHALE